MEAFISLFRESTASFEKKNVFNITMGTNTCIVNRTKQPCVQERPWTFVFSIVFTKT